jgi:hypothetical protein
VELRRMDGKMIAVILLLAAAQVDHGDARVVRYTGLYIYYYFYYFYFYFEKIILLMQAGRYSLIKWSP